MADAFGSITWWGFSPALDFREQQRADDVNQTLEKLNISNGDQDALNILMVGAGDCRHILKTLAQSYQSPKKTIHFYVFENSLELYARHLLLLAIALEPQTRMGLQEKTELFLELFGNTLVRQQSCLYVEKMAAEFIKMVTDFDYLERTMPIIDMSLLKFKERDMLEGIFKFWRNPERNVFDIEKCWDLRLRHHLGVQYDAIPNVFDWDYNMKLVDRGAGIINGRKYSHWRQHGIAFEIREGTYDTPNKTLSSGVVFKKDGERLARRGYWGDTVVSPYISFGLECEDQSFFKKSNNVYTKTSEDVSEYNVLCMMYELANKEKYVPPKVEEQQKDVKATATLTEITEEDEEVEERDQVIPENTDPTHNPLDTEYEPLSLEGVKVTFLPLGYIPDLHKRSKFQNLLNVVYFSNSMVHLLTPDLTATFADCAQVVLETTKFMVNIRSEQSEEFVKKITGMAESAGCKVTAPCSHDKDAFAKFMFTRTS